MSIDTTCKIATCTNQATHAVDGNPDQGYEPNRPLNTCWATYCESHAADVALAFTAVYTRADRDAALDRLNARIKAEPEEAPIRANRAPAPYDDIDVAWAVRFQAICEGRPS